MKLTTLLSVSALALVACDRDPEKETQVFGNETKVEEGPVEVEGQFEVCQAESRYQELSGKECASDELQGDCYTSTCEIPKEGECPTYFVKEVISTEPKFKECYLSYPVIAEL